MKRSFAFAAALLAQLGCATGGANQPVAADALAMAEAEIRPMLAEMLAAANAHDTDRHLAAYIHSPELLFVMNDEAIPGFDSLRVRQRQWWQDGKSDVVYEIVGTPQYRMPASGVVVQTYFLKGTRSVGGVTRSSSLGVSALWQKRPEGWRITYAHEALGATR